MESKKIPAENSSVAEGLDYVQAALQGFRLKPEAVNQAMLAAEESMVKLISHAPKQAKLSITVSKRLGDISIRLTASGEQFDLAEGADFGIPLEMEEVDYEAEMAIRSMVLKSFGDKLKYKNKNNHNTILITVQRSAHRQLYLTLGALVLAILLGTIWKLALPAGAAIGLNTYLLVPFKTMFLNALKMVVGPVVFFSIISCTAQFGNLAEFGKIGAKVMGLYVTTTLIAIGVGLGIFGLVRPGSASLVSSVTSAAAGTVQAAGETSISILDTVVGIVPSNIVKPFLETDMLQIIFIALLCGIAVGMIGDYSRPLSEFFESCNTLFLKITTLIVGFIPAAVFCSMTSLVMTTGTDTLVSLLGLVGTVLLGLACMIGVYCLLIFAVGRLNPLVFLKKYAPTMLTTFSLSSSNAAMPFNMQACRNVLGISPKVCSFSIPLGATVNMDGSCIYLAIVGLFLARVYGISLSGAEMLTLVFSILVLSVGAPGIPGSALVCLSVLLVQIGVPVEAVSLVMGIDPIFSMFRAMSNSTGDVAVALVVAKTEGLVDLDKYTQ